MLDNVLTRGRQIRISQGSVSCREQLRTWVPMATRAMSAPEIVEKRYTAPSADLPEACQNLPNVVQEIAKFCPAALVAEPEFLLARGRAGWLLC